MNQADAIELIEKGQENPDRLADDEIWKLADLLSHTDNQIVLSAAIVLAVVGKENLHQLTPYLDTIKSHFNTLPPTEEYDRDEAQIPMMAILQIYSDDNPAKIKDMIPDLLAILRTGEKSTINAAFYSLSNLAEEFPEETKIATDYAVDYLTHPHTPIRVNVLSMLSQIADENPTQIKPHCQEIQKLLTDDDSAVRNNTVYVLGKCNVNAVTEQLERLAESDPDSSVQHAAKWALQEINTTGQTTIKEPQPETPSPNANTKIYRD